MRMTEINLVDGLAAAAVLAMGESNEQTPFAIIEEAPKVAFVPRYPTPSERQHFSISPEEDLYGPLLKVFKKTCPTEE
jgi:F420-0:gamma-glutamyl ligase